MHESLGSFKMFHEGNEQADQLANEGHTSPLVYQQAHQLSHSLTTRAGQLVEISIRKAHNADPSMDPPPKSKAKKGQIHCSTSHTIEVQEHLMICPQHQQHTANATSRSKCSFKITPT